jgi:hypothetical protein
MITKKIVWAFVGGLLAGCLFCWFVLPHRYQLLVSGPSNVMITKLDRLTGRTWVSMAGQPWTRIGNSQPLPAATPVKPGKGMTLVE